MSKLPRKLRVAGHKLRTSPNITQLLNTAAARIEELEKKFVKDKSAQAHLDALPILLGPLVACEGTGVSMTHQEASRILAAWDKAREVLPQP